MPNVLFLCTGNSARSIMAESYLNHLGANPPASGHVSAAGFRAWSAGSAPTGTPNPLALDTLRRHQITPADGAGAPPASKSWDVFAAPDAPVMDIVITVCDNAAGEICPVWPARPGDTPPEKRHWSFPDPAVARGSEAERSAAFETVFRAIAARIDALVEEGAQS